MLVQVGLNRSCPLACVHLAGIEFPKFTQRVEGHGMETKRSDLPGVTLDLSEEQIAKVKAALGRKFVRSTQGKRARSYLVDTATPGFRPFPDNDVPLAAYAYIKPVEADPFNAPEEPSLLEQGAVKIEAPQADPRRQQVQDTAPNKALAKAAKAKAKAKAEAEAEPEGK